MANALPYRRVVIIPVGDYDKGDKMTDELRHSDDAQHLSGDRRGRRMRVLFSEDSDGKNWIRCSIS